MLVYVGFKGYLWYSIKSDVDDFRALVAPLVEVDYRQIDVSWTSPAGPIGVRGITINPVAVSDQIEVGSALVRPESLRELYELAKALRENRPPDRLHVTFDRIILDLEGPLGEWLNTTSASDDWGSLDAAGCARTRFSAADLIAMGYQRLSNDMALRYRKDSRAGGFLISGSIRTEDMVAVKFEATLPETEFPLADPRLMGGIPKLGTLWLSIRDLGYSDNRNQFCATSVGLDKNEFITNHVAAVRAKLQASGFEPSEELVTAYRSFVADSGEFKLSLDPYDPIGVEEISTLSANTLADRLGISVSYNGAELESLLEISAAVAVEEQDETPKVAPDTYKPTPVASLPQHIHRQVKIYTSDGKLHHAYLEEVGPEDLTLTRHMIGGSATFSVAKADIAKVLVLY